MNAYEQALADFQRAEKERAAALERLEQAKSAQKVSAIAQIRDLMTQYGIAPEDLGVKSAGVSGRKTRKDKGATVAPKYRDPTTGKTWTGRGNPPAWIKEARSAGKLESLLIA